MKRTIFSLIALSLLTLGTFTFANSGGGIYTPIPLPEPLITNPFMLAQDTDATFEVTYVVKTKKMFAILPTDDTSLMFKPYISRDGTHSASPVRDTIQQWMNDMLEWMWKSIAEMLDSVDSVNDLTNTTTDAVSDNSVIHSSANNDLLPSFPGVGADTTKRLSIPQ
jgi:hypothetical protein